MTSRRTHSKLLLSIVAATLFVLAGWQVYHVFAAPHAPEAKITSSNESDLDVVQSSDSKRQSRAAKKQSVSTATLDSSVISPLQSSTPLEQLAATTPESPVADRSPRGVPLYVDPSLTAAGRAPTIANQPRGTWLGSWSGDVRSTADSLVSAATARGELAVMVTYNVPGRDCGSYSTGGLSGSDAYATWVRQLAAGIGNRAAIVIIEPDALAQITCLDASGQAARYASLSDAVDVLSSQTNASIYVDAGHSQWIAATVMAERLQKANLNTARGFALNVSNFQTTADNQAYGDQITASTGKKYVIDTGRNGRGPGDTWCNPPGRGLGILPTTSTSGNIDALLWVKVPGESDGTCGGGPSAGEWWDSYSQDLISNAVF